MSRYRRVSATTWARRARIAENRRKALAAVAEGRYEDIHPQTLRALFSRRLVGGSLAEPTGLTELGQKEHDWNVQYHGEGK